MCHCGAPGGTPTGGAQRLASKVGPLKVVTLFSPLPLPFSFLSSPLSLSLSLSLLVEFWSFFRSGPSNVRLPKSVTGTESKHLPTTHSRPTTTSRSSGTTCRTGRCQVPPIEGPQRVHAEIHERVILTGHISKGMVRFLTESDKKSCEGNATSPQEVPVTQQEIESKDLDLA